MERTKKGHPADGIYYVDQGMLERGRACPTYRDLWKRRYGARRVPITLELLEFLHDPGVGRCVYWGVLRMYMADRITDSEYIAFRKIYDNTTDRATERRAFMDLLAARARREGRLR